MNRSRHMRNSRAWLAPPAPGSPSWCSASTLNTARAEDTSVCSTVAAPRLLPLWRQPVWGRGGEGAEWPGRRDGSRCMGAWPAGSCGSCVEGQQHARHAAAPRQGKAAEASSICVLVTTHHSPVSSGGTSRVSASYAAKVGASTHSHLKHKQGTGAGVHVRWANGRGPRAAPCAWGSRHAQLRSCVPTCDAAHACTHALPCMRPPATAPEAQRRARVPQQRRVDVVDRRHQVHIGALRQAPQPKLLLWRAQACGARGAGGVAACWASTRHTAHCYNTSRRSAGRSHGVRRARHGPLHALPARRAARDPPHAGRHAPACAHTGAQHGQPRQAALPCAHPGRRCCGG